MVLVNKCVSSSFVWAVLALLLENVVATDQLETTSSTSSRHLLEVHNAPFHRARRFLSAHSKTPDDFRQLTAKGVPTVEIDYGGRHPLEQNRQRMTQDRPETSISYGDVLGTLRISYLDDPIRSLLGTGSSAQDDYINYIIDNVLPDAKQLWGNHLTFYQTANNIIVSASTCYGIYPNGASAEFMTNGIPDADVVIYVSMQRNLTTGDGVVLKVCEDPDTLVVSTFCVVDQFGRPLIGLMNFCPMDNTKRMRSLQQQNYPELVDSWQTSPPTSNGTATINSKDLQAATTHQLGHILAMNYDLYRNFYDNGNLATPVHIASTAVCSDNTTQIVLAPSTNTLVRTEAPNGLVYFDLVITRVKALAESHFNCPSAAGRLENDPSQVGCVASHFHQRLFLGEIMSHLSAETAVSISPMTLAVFANAGWYITLFQESYLPYGQGWGCDFFFGDCIVNDTVPDYGKGVYCSTPTVVESDGTISFEKNDIYCDPLHQRWAVCDLFDQTQVPSGFGNLNASRSWFTNKNLLSSSEGFDSCPLPILTLSVDCNDTATSLGVNYQGEVYGANSRCINAEIVSTKRKIPACFNITCDSNQHQVVVNGIPCKYDGEVHTIKTIHGETATMECPRLSLVCPQLFCPSDCAGLGTCDYTQKPPKCNCTDPVNTTAYCESLDDFAFLTSTPAPQPPTHNPGAGSASSVTRTSGASLERCTTTTIWSWSLVLATVLLWSNSC